MMHVRSIVVLLLSLLIAAAPAGAQADAAAMAPAPASALARLSAASDQLLPGSGAGVTSGHTWIALQRTSAEWDLIHMPPRDGSVRSTTGSIRPVVSVRGPIAAMAAWDGRVFIIGQSPLAENRGLVGVSATTRVAPGSWNYAPNGRLETLASIPGRGQVLSLTGSSHGLALLTRPLASTAEPAPATTLRLLDDSEWRTLALPAEAGSLSEMHLLASTSDLILAARNPRDAGLRVFRGVVSRKVSLESVPGREEPRRVVQINVAWSEQDAMRLPAEAIGEAISSGELDTPWWLVHCDGQTVLAYRAPGHVQFWRLSTGVPMPLAKIDAGGSLTAITPLSGLERLTLLNADPPPPPRERRPGEAPGPFNASLASLTVRELSLVSGEVLATAKPHSDPPVSTRDLQGLWLMVLLIGATVLLVVVRAEGPGVVVLPEKTSLAPVGRRMVAGAVDVLAAAALVGLVRGQTPLEVFSAESIAASPVWPTLGLLVAGFAHCLVGEAFFGRSLGKWAVGTRVSAMKRSNETWVATAPTLANVLSRNLIKWALPPVLLAVLIDPSSRHAGDVLGRTVVVLDDAEPEQE